jgi:hypothetical protein
MGLIIHEVSQQVPADSCGLYYRILIFNYQQASPSKLNENTINERDNEESINLD